MPFPRWRWERSKIPIPTCARGCVNAIKQFVAAPLAAAMGIMANTLDREEDVRIREEKQRLLAVVLFGANWTDHVETAEEGIAQFRQRCLNRIAALRQASNGTAESIIFLELP